MTGFSGGCLCGAVRYTSSADPVMMGHCHCEDCRRSGASDRSSHVVVPGAAVKVTGELKAYERAADSGNLVSRCFCPVCGAAVLSTNPAMPDMIFLRASSLDDLEVFKPQMTVFASRAPSWAGKGGEPSFERMPPGMPGG